MFRQLFNSSLIRSTSFLENQLSKGVRNISLCHVHYRKVEATNNLQNQTVELHISDDKENSSKKYEYPFIYLRDNCQCELCFHETSHSRIIDWEHFDVSVMPKSVQYDDDKNKLKIIWSDNDEHKSAYDFEWLERRNFTNANRVNYLKKFYRPEKKLWSKNDFASSLKYFNFNSIINDDCELYNWMRALITYGIAIINGVPSTEKEARAVADRVGFIRRTHYGEEFMVKAKDDTVNVAYLSKNLQMHTDLPYYEYAPGVNLLHCLVQSKSQGAQNLLCDGFYVAEVIRNKYPKEFKLLSTVLIDWLDIGQEETGPPFHSIYRAPMICLDYEHKIERINHSVPQRDSFFAADIETVQEWYKALSLFVKLIHSEAAEIKTDEGTILCFDNSRLTHGRRAYEDRSDNYRHIVGAYLDWDEIYSRYRVLQKQFEI